MKGKKILAVLMATLMLSATAVCTTTVSAYEEDTVVSQDSTTYLYTVGDDTFSYEIVDNTVAIGYYMGTSENVVVPNEIKGMPVTKIYEFAFSKNDSLISVTIPKNVKQLVTEAFHRSYNIQEIIVDPQNSNYSSANGVLYNKDKTTLMYYPPAKVSSDFTVPSTVKEIRTSAFFCNKNLKNIIIPNSVTTLGWYAFEDCENLSSISLPDSITDMGVYTFSGCVNLTTAKLSKNAAVSAHSFAKCKQLKNVTIPEGVKTIYQYAFIECSSLNEIKLPSTLTQIGAYAFASTGMKSITIPKSVTSIQECALGYDNSTGNNVENFVIYGVKGSEAEKYAIENKLSFSASGSQTESVKLNKESITLGINESYTLTPTLSPSGTTTYKWKSNNTKVATINSNGKITAKAEGTANITVETANGSMASCNVTVKKAPTSVSLNKSTLTIGIGEQFDFNSSLPQGTASYNTVYSSSNPNIVNVKAGGGLATGNATGTATITVKTYNGKTATCQVTVKKAPTGITLDKSSVTLGIGDYITLNSKLPSGAASNVVTYTSSDTSIATINDSGAVTAKNTGTVTITAKTYNGKTAVCKITVKNAPASVTLNKNKITMGIGESFDFNSSIPSGTASYNRSFYSYDENIVGIHKTSGLATSKSVGETQIKVTTHNDKTAFADVIVKKAPTRITLNKTSAILGVGETVDLNSKLPSGEASSVFKYTSSNNSIATVDSAGVVTAKQTGTAIITSTTYNGKTATCRIAVKKAPTGLTLNKTSAVIGVGESVYISGKLRAGEASRLFKYSLSDRSIATVDGNGIVIAKSTGTVTLTATTYNGKSATCKITVKNAPTSISLNKTRATLNVGDTLDLNSKLPADEMSSVVTYTSSNNSIATVKGAGIVTANKAGTVTITATTYNGKTATCKITVK